MSPTWKRLLKGNLVYKLPGQPFCPSSPDRCVNGQLPSGPSAGKLRAADGADSAPIPARRALVLSLGSWFEGMPSPGKPGTEAKSTVEFGRVQPRPLRHLLPPHPTQEWALQSRNVTWDCDEGPLAREAGEGGGRALGQRENEHFVKPPPPPPREEAGFSSESFTRYLVQGPLSTAVCLRLPLPPEPTPGRLEGPEEGC